MSKTNSSGLIIYVQKNYKVGIGTNDILNLLIISQTIQITKIYINVLNVSKNLIDKTM